jgi:hypothetical protein
MQKINLIALDLDGTLFDTQGRISPRCLATIHRATELGVHVVISSGRPLVGVPFSQIEGTGISYAITANGAAIYELSERKCLYENAIDCEVFLSILSRLMRFDLHTDVFIDGKAYSARRCLDNAHRLDLPPSLKDYILNTRDHLDDLPQFIREHHFNVQKTTLNFYPDGKGGYTDHDEAERFLTEHPAVDVVSGGFHNLELTRAGVNKGIGLARLAEILGVDPAETMAIGDTGNDLAIIRAAGIGVAMGNGTEDVKAEADYITTSNDEDGVARAIEHFIPATAQD